MLWKLTEKQKEMSRIIEQNKMTLCIGQGRTGKTLLIVTKMFRDAIKYPNTNQAIFRNTLASAVDGIWKITVKEVIANFFPALPLMEGFKINETDHEITFPNGSRIVLKGLDNKERVQKILSTQWMQIFLDEAHLIQYEHVGLLLTRLPQPLDVDYKVRIICAANWCPNNHWLKTFFADGLNPETKTPHEQPIGIITSITQDNTTINAEEYLDTLNKAGDRRSRLMCAGNGFYNELDGAIWQISYILRKPRPDTFDKIVLAFDPAVSNTSKSDEHGVCIAGSKYNKEKSQNEFYVLNCFEKKADMNDIAKEVIALYHQYGCQKLIYEENNGGKWIETLIKNHAKDVLTEGIRARVGKLLRAEPIAGLYCNGVVFHCGQFRQLEEQMLTFDGNGDSPNALDALVYAIQFLNVKKVARGPM
jgi:predicted phage terminase large subunit-like protein